MSLRIGTAVATFSQDEMLVSASLLWKGGKLMRIQYRKPERPDLLLLVIAMMVWAGLIIYSPLGPFATDPAGQAGDVIVAYTPR